MGGPTRQKNKRVTKISFNDYDYDEQFELWHLFANRISAQIKTEFLDVITWNYECCRMAILIIMWHKFFERNWGQFGVRLSNLDWFTMQLEMIGEMNAIEFDCWGDFYWHFCGFQSK